MKSVKYKCDATSLVELLPTSLKGDETKVQDIVEKMSQVISNSLSLFDCKSHELGAYEETCFLDALLASTIDNDAKIALVDHFSDISNITKFCSTYLTVLENGLAINIAPIDSLYVLPHKEKLERRLREFGYKISVRVEREPISFMGRIVYTSERKISITLESCLCLYMLNEELKSRLGKDADLITDLRMYPYHETPPPEKALTWEFFLAKDSDFRQFVHVAEMLYPNTILHYAPGRMGYRIIKSYLTPVEIGKVLKLSVPNYSFNVLHAVRDIE